MGGHGRVENIRERDVSNISDLFKKEFETLIEKIGRESHFTSGRHREMVINEGRSRERWVRCCCWWNGHREADVVFWYCTVYAQSG